jgi:NAD(P)-dependent dehydrogenase (short-subunit alcohol dehydrogenase family)
MKKESMTALAASAGLVAALAAAAMITQRKKPAFTLQDKVVLITGGGRGLGFLLAREFARKGARVAIAARDTAELESAKLKLFEIGHNISTFACDVTDEAEVQAMVKAVDEQMGRVDILVNNAGVIMVGPVEEMTREDWEQAMRTHFWAPLNTMNTVIPQMRARQAGRIVNISSIGGKIPAPHLLPYVASKFALTGLSEGMRTELAKDKIVVTTVCPGLMRTGSPEQATFKGQHTKEYAWFSASDTIPGLSMSADEAAKEIVNACVRGDAEVVLSLPAQLAARAYGLFPSFVVDAEAIINRLLPGKGGIGKKRAVGAESHGVAPAPIVAATENIAAANNEFSRETVPA